MSLGLHREVVIILGKTGYGKSTWLAKYAELHPRIFVFDPFAKFPAQYLTGDAILSNFENGDYRAEAAPSLRIGTNAIGDLDLLGAIAYQSKRCAFIIEECGFAFYKGERIPDWLSEIVFLGRHHEVSLILTAQRAISIPVELRSQANRFVSFRQTEKQDIKWTEQYIGDRFLELPELPKFTCLDADEDSVTSYVITPPGMKSTDLQPEPGRVESNYPESGKPVI